MESVRQFPQSLEAERAILGGILLDPDQIPSMAELVQADDFYREAHGRLFELLLERSERGEPLDVLGVTDHLISSGQESAFGGVPYVSALPGQVPVTQNLVHYARIVKEKAIRRRLLQVAQEIQDQTTGGVEELPQLLDFAESRIFQVSQQRSARDWQSLGQVLDHEWVRLEELSENRGDVTGVSTGFVDLDHMLAGLQRTDLVILAARPAMGKTALALGIAQNVALRGGGVGVGLFSLEMGRGQLAVRMLCSEARVDAGRVRTGKLSKDRDWPKLLDASERLYHAPFWIDDTPALTITQIRSKARRLKAEHPELGLIVLDYLQLMQGSGGSRESREQVISSISRGLKGLAKELDLPVLALSQLNRGVESRTDKRPMLSDLRESGAIEQDADVILFIYRDEYYNEQTEDQGIAEVIVAKQRNGPTGTAKLVFLGQYTRFENLARSSDLPGGYG